ncbi:transcription initiation factor TFIIB [Pycnococcus provasolii]
MWRSSSAFNSDPLKRAIKYADYSAAGAAASAGAGAAGFDSSGGGGSLIPQGAAGEMNMNVSLFQETANPFGALTSNPAEVGQPQAQAQANPFGALTSNPAEVGQPQAQAQANPFGALTSNPAEVGQPQAQANPFGALTSNPTNAMTRQLQQQQHTRKEEAGCPMCGSFDIIDDHAQGDRVCQQCGYVVDGSYIDESAEWRNFRDSGKGEGDGKDKSRTGGATNNLLMDGGLGTVIGKNGRDNRHIGLQRAQARLMATHRQTALATLPQQQRGATTTATTARAGTTEPTAERQVNTATIDKNLKIAFGEISDICERLELNVVIRECAKELFRDCVVKVMVGEDGKRLKKPFVGAGEPNVYAAVVFIACTQEGAPRILKEIVSATPKSMKTKIQQAFSKITKYLGPSYQRRIKHTGDHISRFCSNLPIEMPKDVVRCARSVAENLEKLEAERDVGMSSRQPATVTATIIWFVVSAYNLKQSAAGAPLLNVTVADIEHVTDVSQSTIRSLEKVLGKEADSLLPEWFIAPSAAAQAGET